MSSVSSRSGVCDIQSSSPCGPAKKPSQVMVIESTTLLMASSPDVSWITCFLLVPREPLFFTFEDGILDRKALFPPLSRLLSPGFKLREGLLVEAVEMLLRLFFHHH